MKSFYSSFLSPGDLCFDVGANVGNRTKIFQKLCKTVVAVEPQSECVNLLRRFFNRDPRVTVVQTALGSTEGSAEMAVSNVNSVSSLSREWIETARETGRFGEGVVWDRAETVPVTTLDHLIKRFGDPAFIKVDVEGYELEVFSGLSRPVRAVSFEFTPERIQRALKILDLFSKLGQYEANYALNEEMSLKLGRWVAIQSFAPMLEGLSMASEAFGDIYLRRI